MRISAVIPCHNAAQWISEALRSVREQTHPPEETIVVNDSSSDNTTDRVRANTTRAELLEVMAGNPAVARNAGVKKATGDWIAFLDADDIWYADHLYCAARILASSDDIAYLGHTDAFLNKSGETGEIEPFPPARPMSGLTAEQFVDWLAGRVFFSISSCIVRKDVLLECGAFDPDIRRDDIDMWLRTIHDRTWSYNPMATSAYRIDTPDSVSSDSPRAQYHLLKAMVKNRDLYPEKPMKSLIRYAARSAMYHAIVQGKASERERARTLAWPDLLLFDHAMFTVGRFLPTFLQHAARIRRAVLGLAEPPR